MHRKNSLFFAQFILFFASNLIFRASTVLQTQPGTFRRVPARQRSQARFEAVEELVPAPKSQHSSHEVAKPKSGSEPNRAFMESTKTPRPRKKI